MQDKIKVFIVEDHQVLREHYVSLLSYEPDIIVAGCADNSHDAIQGAKEFRPDVILMDIELESSDSGLAATKAILDSNPETKIIMLTVHDDESTICKSFQAGAVNYVLKSSSAVEIIHNIKDASNGFSSLSSTVAATVIKEFKRMSSSEDSLLYVLHLLTNLTDAERRILLLLCKGTTQKEICKVRYIELSTVKTHVKNILRKLDKKTTREVVQSINELGLMSYLIRVVD